MRLLFRFFLVFFVLLLPRVASAQLDSVRARLSRGPVQEKVYLHLDNNAYFLGDTLWYKAYVVRADDLRYTHLSRILYVELITPDGFVVQRHNLIATDQGYGDGCFVLQDSLYSGYYELRAYTRWMMNFCVRQHPHIFTHTHNFFTPQMAEAYFAEYDALYSRVVPVYERPLHPGDYGERRMVARPKTRLDAEPKPSLSVSFFPEGGHLVAGTRCRVAFEATDEQGRQVPLQGVLHLPHAEALPLATMHEGRGVFECDVPASGRLHASFSYQGKDYSFTLPKAEARGVALQLRSEADGTPVAHLSLAGLNTAAGYAVAVLCRGVLRSFQPFTPQPDGSAHLALPHDSLPTGVNNLVVVDSLGTLLADRLFFVNHHDYDAPLVTLSPGHDTLCKPLQPVELSLQAPADAHHLSVSVTDHDVGLSSYDTDNILTSLLLTSELRGFVAHPHAYFAHPDDACSQQALDVLMLVQGWRRYDCQTIYDAAPLRYRPEQCMTVSGGVYPMLGFAPLLPGEARNWKRGVFGVSVIDAEQAETHVTDAEQVRETVAGQEEVVSSASVFDYEYDQRPGALGHEATLLGELILGDEIADVELQTTDGGRFSINIPPYFGEAILFLRAQKTDVSERKAHRLADRGRTDETQWPEFYVKRDLIYPVHTSPYSYYQCHAPESDSTRLHASSLHLVEADRISTMDAELDNVDVRARRRRGSRAIDYSRPALTYDAYQLYNLVTDYGLSYGKLNVRNFPRQVCAALFGSYDGGSRAPSIRMLFSGVTVYQTDTVMGHIDLTPDHFSDYAIESNLYLYRWNQFRVYTDFEPRHFARYLQHSTGEPGVADVTIDVELMPNDSRRYSYRDRRIRLDGFHMPPTFYSPDYSRRPLPEGVTDHRRTLYWNANLPLDAEGRASLRFFNNSSATQFRITVAGLTADGHPIAVDTTL